VVADSVSAGMPVIEPALLMTDGVMGVVPSQFDKNVEGVVTVRSMLMGQTKGPGPQVNDWELDCPDGRSVNVMVKLPPVVVMESHVAAPVRVSVTLVSVPSDGLNRVIELPSKGLDANDPEGIAMV
jgi:hypothetical protein